MARTTTQTTKVTPPAKGKAGAAATAKVEPKAVASTAKAAALAPAKAVKPKAGPKHDVAPQVVAKPAKARVVTLKHLAAGVADERGTSKPETLVIAMALIEDLVAQVMAGARVKIPGLGTIEVKNRPARMGRNPATGEPVQVAASRKLMFRPAKQLKSAI